MLIMHGTMAQQWWASARVYSPVGVSLGLQDDGGCRLASVFPQEETHLNIGLYTTAYIYTDK